MPIRKNPNVPPRLVLAVVIGTLTGIGALEWRALYALDHPPVHRTDCVSCHADAKTFAKMADKAGKDYWTAHAEKQAGY